MKPSFGRLLALFTLIAAMLVLGVSVTYGQAVNATLLGTITDSSGAVVAGVTVTATNTATGLERITVTDETGSYDLVGLPPGSYSLKAQRSGFKTALLSNIQLQVAQKARVNISLDLGEIQQQVTVTGQAPLVKSESPEISGVVGQREIEDLPLKNRNFMGLVTLTGGTNEGDDGATAKGFFLNKGFGPSAAGQPTTENSYQLDGADNTELYFKTFNVVPSVDAIAEFRVQVGQYSAEFGGGGGAVVNVITRSGTNNFHGTVFGFFRNDHLQARNFFALTKPKFRESQFGGSIGGPIIHNKSFFFLNYDGNRTSRPVTFAARVPTQAQRDGDLSGFNKTIMDPSTGNPFPGNVIPSNRISPVSTFLMKYYPLPNNAADPLRNWIASTNSIDDHDNWQVRVDHLWKEKHQIMARHVYNGLTRFSPGPFSEATFIGASNNDANFQNLIFGATSTFKPTLINEFRASWDYTRGDGFLGQQFGKNPISRDAGLKLVVPLSQDAVGFPNFVLSQTGISSLSDPRPWLLKVNAYEVSDAVSWIRRKHTLKAGGSWETVRSQNKIYLVYNGVTIFGGQITGDGFSDFLLGNPNTIVWQQNKVAIPWDGRWSPYSAYVQDSWHYSDRLTLTLGMRYEFAGVPKDTHGNFAIFDKALGGPRYEKQNTDAAQFYPVFRPDLPWGLLDRDNMWFPDRNNFAPRLGFAYRPSQGTRTVIRGGYGWFYSQMQSDLLQNAGFVPPAFQIASLAADPTKPQFGWDGPPSVNPTDLFKGALFTIAGSQDHFLNAYTQQWSLSVSREISTNFLIEGTYLGSKSTHLETRVDENTAPPAPGAYQSRLPFPQWGRIIGWTSGANADYQSFILSAEKRYSQGFQFKSSWTFSKSIGSYGARNRWGNIADVQNPANARADTGLTADDARHRFTFNSVYELPLGPGKHFGSSLTGVTGKVVGDWKLTGLVSLRTGFPVNITIPLGFCNNNGVQCRPNRMASQAVNLGGNGVDAPKFNVAAFQVQASPSFGNAGPNIATDNGLNVADLGVSKGVRWADRYRVEFRLEMFNAFNHPNFGTPSADPTDPSFGRTFSAGPSREIQLGLKFYW